MKKLLSIILLATLCLGLSAPAFADGAAAEQPKLKEYEAYSENFDDDAVGAYTGFTLYTGENNDGVLFGKPFKSWGTSGTNVTMNVEDNNGNKRLVITNNEALVDGNTLQNNAYLQIVPASVMDEHKDKTYSLEYDMTFISNGSNFAYAGAGMLFGFDGTTYDAVSPLMRACGRGNNWTFKTAESSSVPGKYSVSFGSNDNNTVLNGNAWLGAVTGNQYSFNETLPGGQIGCTLTVKVDVTTTTMNVYAKYGMGDYVLISKTDSENYREGYTDMQAILARTAGIGFTIWPQVSVALDNIRVSYIDCDHEYDNACDTTCNNCQKERAIEHSYKSELSMNENAHYYECEVCGHKSQITAHKYVDGKCSCGAEKAETATTDTSSADTSDGGSEAEVAEEGGCGSAIGIGALAIAIPAAFAVAIPTKRRKK